MNVCIAGATITGLAFVVQPLMIAIASEIVPRRHRANIQALANVTSGIAGLLAIFACGGLIKNDVGGEGWRYIFVLVTCM